MAAPPQIPSNDKQAIEDLRDLSALAISDLERAMGGSLTSTAMSAIRNWLARAFEAGNRYGYDRGLNDPSRVPTVRPPKSKRARKKQN